MGPPNVLMASVVARSCYWSCRGMCRRAHTWCCPDCPSFPVRPLFFFCSPPSHRCLLLRRLEYSLSPLFQAVTSSSYLSSLPGHPLYLLIHGDTHIRMCPVPVARVPLVPSQRSSASSSPYSSSVRIPSAVSRSVGSVSRRTILAYMRAGIMARRNA